MVGMEVRPQDAARLHAPALGGGQQRQRRRATVDEDGLTALPVGDEVGVREPLRVHAPFDQHRRIGYAPANGEEDEVAGLFERMSLVIKSKLNKLLDRAEDPSETLDYSYEQQLQLLQNVKRGIADVVTSKKRLQLQADKLEQSLVKLDTQARDALAAGREDLARQALERKTLAQQQLQDLDRQVEQLEAQQEKLATSERQLSAKIDAFRSQKEVIQAQSSAAEAQVRIGEAATGIGEQMADTGLAIQRAKDKTEQMQARASAIDELTTSGALEDFTSDQTQLDRELGAVASKSQVDKELEQMKAELGSGEGKKELTQ